MKEIVTLQLAMATKTVMPAPAANTANIAMPVEAVVVSVVPQFFCPLSEPQSAATPVAHSAKALQKKDPDAKEWSKEEDIATSTNDDKNFKDNLPKLPEVADQWQNAQQQSAP